MRERESVTGTYRQRQRGRERKKERKEIHCTKRVLKRNKHLCASLKWRQRGKINISGEGNQADFQESGWGQMQAEEM